MAIMVIASAFVIAKQYATTDTGKRVVLHEDGTWEYTKLPEKPAVFEHDFRRATWGMNMERVKKTEESPVVFEGWSETDDATILYYKEMVFDLPTFITYLFRGGKLVQARYSFNPEDQGNYISDYESIIEGLIDKYGEPFEVTMQWSDSTYADDEEQWETALRLGHLKRSGFWETKNTLIVLQLYARDKTIIMQIDYSDKTFVPDSEL
jgi:hypothetical protein